MRKFLKYALFTALAASPVLTWAYIKPIRVIAPEVVGLTCVDEFVCVDDVSRIGEAKLLYDNAIQFVQVKLGKIKSVPRAIFCSSKDCSSSFGLHQGSYGYAGAYNVGTFGFVISYRGWHPHYVRHELIHHIQNEHLGSINNWFFKPNWFLEGMAYSLSEDPRSPLPKVLEGYRNEYDLWSSNLSVSQVWTEAKKL